MKYPNTMRNYIKTPANDLQAGDVFHVGEYISEEMEARDMKQVELSEALEISKSEMSLILNGKRNLTILLALNLEKIWGINALIWMRLQIRYQVESMRIEYGKQLQKNKLPLRKKLAFSKVVHNTG
jgi:addiction module HigA family antidote